MSDIQSMIGKKVEVTANGIIYSGVLIEVSDVEVHLKGPYQWISLPVSAISGIKINEPEPAQMGAEQPSELHEA